LIYNLILFSSTKRREGFCLMEFVRLPQHRKPIVGPRKGLSLIEIIRLPQHRKPKFQYQLRVTHLTSDT